jgi:hypothetical protein
MFPRVVDFVLFILLWAHSVHRGIRTVTKRLAVFHMGRQCYSVCKGLHSTYKLMFRYEYPKLSVKSHMHIRADVKGTVSLFRHLQ